MLLPFQVRLVADNNWTDSLSHLKYTLNERCNTLFLTFIKLDQIPDEMIVLIKCFTVGDDEQLNTEGSIFRLNKLIRSESNRDLSLQF